MSKKVVVKKPEVSTGESIAKPVNYGIIKRFQIFVFALYQFANNGLVSGRTGGDVKMRNGRSRKMTVPSLVRNAYTQAARGLLATLSSMWNTLSLGEIASWNNYILTASNRFGVKITIKGKAAFVRINTNLTLIGNSPNILPTLGTTVESVELDSVTAVADTSISLNYTAVTSPSVGLIYATKSFSVGVSRPSQAAFRLIAIHDFTIASPVSIFAEYMRKFGTCPSGARIFVQVRNIDNAGGLSSPVTQIDFVVP